MDGPQAIIALVFVALVLTGSAIAVSISSKTTADAQNVTDTLESDAVGTLLETNNSNVEGAYYSDNATVVNESSNETLSGPTDFIWHRENGTLSIESQKAANTRLSVTYVWYERTDNQIAQTEISSYIIQAGIWIPLVLFIALLFIALGIFGGLS